VSKYWRENAVIPPRIDPDEFDPGSQAALFLRVKSGDWLTPGELESAGPDLAWEWLRRRSESLLQETSLNHVIPSVRAAAGHEFQALEQSRTVAANVARVCFRAGEWEDAVRIPARMTLGAPKTADEEAASLSLLRTWFTVAAKTGVAGDFGSVTAWLERVADPVARVELLAHLMLARHDNRPDASLLERAIAEVSPSHWSSEPRVLRLAILLAKPNRDLLSIYLQTAERLPRDRATAELVRRVFVDCYSGALTSATEAAYGQLINIGRIYPVVVEATDTLFRLDKAPLLRWLERPDILGPWMSIVAADHRDWLRPLGFAVDRLLEARPKARGEIAASLASTSDPIMRESSPPAPVVYRSVFQASEDGILLPLARALVDVDRATEQGRYPHTAGTIAAALLDWDARLKDRLPPRERPSAAR
jgi:hypothetical protein